MSTLLQLSMLVEIGGATVEEFVKRVTIFLFSNDLMSYIVSAKINIIGNYAHLCL